MIEKIDSIKTKLIRTFICEKCGLELPTDKDYKQHRIDHNLGKSFKTIHPVTGEPIEPKQPKIPKPTVLQPPVVSIKGSEIQKTTIDTSPITLKYIYHGTCPICKTNVETIPLEVEIEKTKKFIVVAWCNKCKKSIQQRNVAKI